MTQIQILGTKRNNGYLELSYKMVFTLPAIFGTGANPIDGLDKILSSYPDGFTSAVIPITGTVISISENISISTTMTLPQIQTQLQARYTTIRTKLDFFTLGPNDNIAGLGFDGTTWATIKGITDFPIIDSMQSNLCVTNTAATGVAVTLTLPAVPNKFHNISYIQIKAYSTAARTGNATPIVVTTTNINGNPALTFSTVAAIGATDKEELNTVVRSFVANTATTIVCPATPSVIWRVLCFYNVSG